MKNKDSWTVKLIKFTYGVKELDEYRVGELNRIGNNAFMIIYLYLILFVFFNGIFIPFISPQAALAITSKITIFIFMGVSAYIYSSVAKLKLNVIEIDDNNDYSKKLKKMKIKAFLGGIIFFILERITMFTQMDNPLNSKSFIANLISWQQNIIWLVVSIIFGIIIYFILKRKIQK